MKKHFLPSLLAVLTSFLMAAGCKKNWNCECRTQLGDGTYIVTSTTLIENKTKKDAKAACDALDTMVGGVMVNDCSLK